MAANSYYSHLPSNVDLSAPHSKQSSPLKPMFLAGNHMAQQHDAEDHLAHVRKKDDAIKHHIRVLRVISRLLATGLSLAVLVPITMTLHKFLTTNNIYKDVTTSAGTVNRTAWSLKTKAWPTYMYFSIAATSFFMNLATLIAYFWSVKKANLVSTMSTFFNVFIAVANLVVWIVAAGIYKYEKEVTENGKHNDLWGWTCSAAADAIQHAFVDEVPFDKFCTVQAASWYAGLVQVGAMVLSVIIFLMTGRRRTTKGAVKRRTGEYEDVYGGPGSYGGQPHYGH